MKQVNERKRVYDRPRMLVVAIRHHEMLMSSVMSAGGSLGGYSNGSHDPWGGGSAGGGSIGGWTDNGDSAW